MTSIYSIFPSKSFPIHESSAPYHELFFLAPSASSPFIPFQDFFDDFFEKEEATLGNFTAIFSPVELKVAACLFRDASLTFPSSDTLIQAHF